MNARAIKQTTVSKYVSTRLDLSSAIAMMDTSFLQAMEAAVKVKSLSFLFLNLLSFDFKMSKELELRGS